VAYVLITEGMSPEQRQQFDVSLAALDPREARRQRLAFARGGVEPRDG